MALVPGIDVSRYQPKVDWQKVKNAGIAFAVAKASQSNWVDPMFATHWAGAKSAGLLRGAYHYFVPDMDPLKQAAAYLKALGDDPGELPPVLDIEAKTTSPAKFARDAEVWLVEVEKKLNRKPIIYTAAWYWNSGMFIGGKYPAWAANYPLWVATYALKDGAPTLEQLSQSKFKPNVPKSWSNWTLWQYSERGRVEGITNTDNRPTNVDLNIFSGSLEDFGAWLGLDPARLADLPSYTPPPASFDVMLAAYEPPAEELPEDLDALTMAAMLARAMEAEAPAQPRRKPSRKAKKPAKKSAKSAKKASRKSAKKSSKSAKKTSRKSAKKTAKTSAKSGRKRAAKKSAKSSRASSSRRK